MAEIDMIDRHDLLLALTDDEPREQAWPIACLKDILDQLVAENWSADKKDPESWDDALAACRLMLSRLTAALRPVAKRRAAEGNVPAPERRIEGASLPPLSDDPDIPW